MFSPQDYETLKQGKSNGAAYPPVSELLAAFRGSGQGGGAARLVAEREAERLCEA